MEKDLKERLVSKGFVFVNQIKKTIGLSKKGNKTTDIEQILDFANKSDENYNKVVSTIETLEIAKQSRFVRIKETFSEIRENWEELVIHIQENDNVPENIQNIVEKIDNVIDFFFRR